MLAPESFMRLLSLANDLSRIKNWEIDGKPLPGMPPTNSTRRAMTPDAAEESGLRKRISILMLMITFGYIVLEPPVTILGIVTAVLLAVLAAVNMMLTDPFGSLLDNKKRKGIS
jgi:hypothetical protein